MLKLAFSLLTGLFFSVLAADLLYLYYAGGWHEPIKLIEMTEVVILYIFCVWGIAWVVVAARSHISKAG